MTKGLNEFYKNNGLDYKTYWQPSDDPDVINTYILNNINNDIPVIMSYFNKTSKTDCKIEKELQNGHIDTTYNCLQCYEADTNNISNQKIVSHYFVITGVFMEYNVDKNIYDTYYQISTWGEKYNIKADDFLNNLNWFTNIVYTDVD